MTLWLSDIMLAVTTPMRNGKEWFTLHSKRKCLLCMLVLMKRDSQGMNSCSVALTMKDWSMLTGAGEAMVMASSI